MTKSPIGVGSSPTREQDRLGEAAEGQADDGHHDGEVDDPERKAQKQEGDAPPRCRDR